MIEDDYDAEYRYDRAPIGAVQGLAPEHVIHAHSVSKTLAPGMRLGWAVLPSHLAADVAAEKRHSDLGTPVLEQLALDGVPRPRRARSPPAPHAPALSPPP